MAHRAAKYVVLNTGPGSREYVIATLGNRDFSHLAALKLVLDLTKAASLDGAADTLVVYLQEKVRGVWCDRLALQEVDGTLTPSVNVPEVRIGVVWAQGLGDLTAGELHYEPSGSAGAGHIAAGSAINGPFSGKNRQQGVGLQDNWRLVAVVTDANSNADFEGELELWAYLPGEQVLAG